jgi:hypothetical protein
MMCVRLLYILLISIPAYVCEIPLLFADDQCIPGLDRDCVPHRVTGGSEFCAKESGYKSLNADQVVRVQFTNATNGRINIYWLNYDGHRILFNTLRKGENHSFQTYVTHPWVITTTHDACLMLYLPSSDPNQFVTISKPPGGPQACPEGTPNC